MRIFVILFAFLLTGCLEDIKVSNPTLSKALAQRCEDKSSSSKCIFENNERVVEDLGVEILKDDKNKVYHALCVDLSDNAEHCGRCGFRCEEGAQCSEGTCVKQCGKNESLNDEGKCYCKGFGGEMYNTNEHCGECGNRCDESSSCTQTGEEFKCVCSSERNLDSNIRHCGTCDNDCNSSVLNVVYLACTRGRCNYTTCEEGFIDLDKDRTNGCERELSKLHIKYMTPDGVPVCAEQYKNCNSIVDDGCESRLDEVKTCGDCGNDCTEKVLNAEVVNCTESKCDYEKCKENFSDCDKDRSNGCEANKPSCDS